MAKTEKEKDDASKIKCPVCGELLFDLDEEESYCGICEHVILTYSTFNGDFGEMNGPGYDIAEEMEAKVEENLKHEDEDDYEEICIEDLIRELGEDPESPYQLIEVSMDGLACGPISETVLLLVEMPEEDVQDIQNKDRIKYYTEAIRKKPNDVDLFISRGIEYCSLNEYRKGIKDYTKALRLQPDYPGLYLNRGLCHQFLEEYPKAIRDYNAALRVDPEDTDAYYHKATCYALQNKAKQACKWLKQAMDRGYKTHMGRVKEDFESIKDEACFVKLMKEYKA
ncbi:MAG TPA: tetratricopeptide repeat protein [Smithellaceae bacterium]|nr:tetratricopeptide repeat protein [Smithellaceae bacterium]